MKELILPLVEQLVRGNSSTCLTDVAIIGVQHILETTHSMFRSLYKLGLKPSNVALVGKCYSTNNEVYNEMLADGIDVDPASMTYAPDQPFDSTFSESVKNFINVQVQRTVGRKLRGVIVLDDGGKCISYINQRRFPLPVAAVEQTSSGYAEICKQMLKLPVVNVARCGTKLAVESPMIAEAVVDRLEMGLSKHRIFVDRALVIGAGAIGQAVRDRLAGRMAVTMHDRDPQKCEGIEGPLQSKIGLFPLIIGCSGYTSVPRSMHGLIKAGTTLVSASSSDREFDAVYLRRLAPLIPDCHENVSANGCLLLNSGFPVNFDGARENIELEQIQLTIALMTAGILQAAQQLGKSVKGMISLDENLERTVIGAFCSLQKRSTFSSAGNQARQVA